MNITEIASRNSEEPAEMIWMMTAGYLASSGVHGDLVHKLQEKFIETAKKDIAKAIRKSIRESIRSKSNA